MKSYPGIRRDDPDGFALGGHINVGGFGASASLVVLPNLGIYGSVDLTGGVDIESLRRLGSTQRMPPSRLLRPALAFGGTVGSVYLNGKKRRWKQDLPGTSETYSAGGSVLGGFYSSSVDAETNQRNSNVLIHGVQVMTPSRFNIGGARSRTVGFFTIEF